MVNAPWTSKGGKREMGYREKYAALLLALGKQITTVAKEIGMSRSGLRDWKRHKIFADEIKKQAKTYWGKKRREAIKEMTTMERELEDLVQTRKDVVEYKGADVVRSMVELAKIKGEYRDLKKSKDWKDAEKKSDKELDKRILELNKYFKEQILKKE